ncbi:MAG: DUF3604 domain-containing protein [Bryobacterales bacterium]|nr:DUF3604 domain-containing protein [Bryobacterales bacterium]
MKRLAVILGLFLACSAALAQEHPLRALNIEFGIKDHQPIPWDGSLSIDKGEIVDLRGYRFKEGESIGVNNSWVARTDPWVQPTGGMHPHELPFPHATRVQDVGVTLYYRAPDDATVSVKTVNGDFFFKPADLPPSDAMHILSTKVELRRVPPVEALTTDEFEDDYPAMAMADDGTLSAAWIGYKDEDDQVFARDRANGEWGEIASIGGASGDLQGLAAAYDRNGTLHLVWSKRNGGTWILLHATRSNGSWSAPSAVGEGSGNNLFPVMASDRHGGLHLAWQSAREGFSGIYYSAFDGSDWSDELPLSHPGAAANEWYPDIASNTAGTAWVVWDSYQGGSYNIRLRSVSAGRAGDLVKVTDTPRYHGTPSIAVDAQDRVWISYDESDENWGKDTGFLLRGGTGIYQSRTNRVVVWNGSEWLAPLDDVNRRFRPSVKRYIQTPKLAPDSEGRMWLLLRPRVRSTKPESLWAAGGKWEVMATYYSGDRWADPFPLPDSVGRNEGPMDVVAGADGKVYATWTTDQKLWGGPNFGHYPKDNQIFFAELSAQFSNTRIDPPLFGPRGVEPPAMLPTEPREAEQVAAIRNYTIDSGGKRYKIYRGDMHRHTDISLDGTGDGSLYDSFRYMMDGAAMDFYLVTDHKGSNDTEYSWWRTEKAEDMFHVPGRFVTLFGYERSLSYPNGHRNIIYAERGNRPIRITQEERESSSGPFLYDALRKQKGIATSHTSHTSMGTDWRDNDPELEPIVEIFQGARTSAEHEGAPLASSAARTDLWAGSYRPKGFVWLAWEKGYKLGVQASSDHVSTHSSYAMVLSDDYSRQGLVDAMRQRHTYAATSNIILDYRLKTSGGEWIQGDEFSSTEIPTATVLIRGTGAIKEAVVVRDNTYVHTLAGDGESMEFEFREQELAAGEHYYYVRVEQEDGNVAWSSPIWVTKK